MNKRLKKAIKALNLTYNEFAIKIEEKEFAVKAMVSGTKKITPELALIIESKTGISASWILLDKGSIFDKPANIMASALGDNTLSRLAIPFYSKIKAIENGFDIDNEDIEIISLPKILLDNKIKGGKIHAIKINDDSMSPTINLNDIIFVDSNFSDIVNNKMYLIKYADEIKVVRAFKRIQEKILIKSDNPAYPDEEISLENNSIKVIGQVIYSLKDFA